MPLLTRLFAAHRMGTLVALAALVLAVLPADGRARAGRTVSGVPAFSTGLFDPIPNRELRSLKTDFVRVTAKWNTLEPSQGVYDWSSLDAQVLPRTRAGYQVIILLNSDSAWGTVCGVPDRFSAPKPSKVPAFKAFVNAMVERYDGDGFQDVHPAVRTPIRYWEIENQWQTAVFFRDSHNCGAAGFGNSALVQIGANDEVDGVSAQAVRQTPEDTGNPLLAAREYVREYRAFFSAARGADLNATVGPGNIPTQTTDAALFCQGKLGRFFTVNAVKADGQTIGRTYQYTKQQVCRKGGENKNHIKNWVRYWNVVLQKVMPKLRGQIDYVDQAQYGFYYHVDDRNTWVKETARKPVAQGGWGYSRVPQIVAWEMAGIDLRVSIPGADIHQDSALDLVKRFVIGFATGARSQTWFHYYYNPGAAPAVERTSLHDESGKKLPAYFNYRLLVTRLDGALSARMQSLGRGKGYLVRFALPGGQRVSVAWADAGLHQVLKVHGDTVQTISATGKRAMPEVSVNSPGGKLSIHLTATPVLILD